MYVSLHGKDPIRRETLGFPRCCHAKALHADLAFARNAPKNSALVDQTSICQWWWALATDQWRLIL